MSVQFTLIGLEDLKRELRELPTHLRAEAVPIVGAHGAQAAAAIQQAYPERTGTLRARVRSTMESGASGFGAQARVRSGAPHALLYERGTVRRRNRRGANRGIMPARPVFGAIMADYRARMWRALAALLERAGLQVSGV